MDTKRVKTFIDTIFASRAKTADKDWVKLWISEILKLAPNEQMLIQAQQTFIEEEVPLTLPQVLKVLKAEKFRLWEQKEAIEQARRDERNRELAEQARNSPKGRAFFARFKKLLDNKTKI